MVKRIVKFFADLMLEEGVETALCAVVGAVSFAPALVLFGSILEMAMEYPVPLGACCGLSFALGMVTTIEIHRISRMRGRRATRQVINELPDDQAALLFNAFMEGGVIETLPPSRLCRFPEESMFVLEKKGLVDFVSERSEYGGVVRTWVVTVKACDALNGKKRLLEDLLGKYRKVYGELME